MGTAGARRIEEKFSWRLCAEKTLELYDQVLLQRRHLPDSRQINRQPAARA